jgi:hypothetical protein
VALTAAIVCACHQCAEPVAHPLSIWLSHGRCRDSQLCDLTCVHVPCSCRPRCLYAYDPSTEADWSPLIALLVQLHGLLEHVDYPLGHACHPQGPRSPDETAQMAKALLQVRLPPAIWPVCGRSVPAALVAHHSIAWCAVQSSNLQTVLLPGNRPTSPWRPSLCCYFTCREALLLLLLLLLSMCVVVLLLPAGGC